MSLNSTINLRSNRVNSKSKPLTKNQKTAIISFYKSGKNNSIPEIAKRVGSTYGRVDYIINQHLKAPEDQEFIILESKMNKL